MVISSGSPGRGYTHARDLVVGADVTFSPSLEGRRPDMLGWADSVLEAVQARVGNTFCKGPERKRSSQPLSSVVQESGRRGHAGEGTVDPFAPGLGQHLPKGSRTITLSAVRQIRSEPRVFGNVCGASIE